MISPFQLWRQVPVTGYRACNKLWKKADVYGEAYYVSLNCGFPPVNCDKIADTFKCKEGNAKGKYDFLNKDRGNSKKTGKKINVFNKKVSVLKDQKQWQVQDYPQDKECFSSFFSFAGTNDQSCKIIDQYENDKY